MSFFSKKVYTYNTTTLLSENTYSYENSNWQDLLTKFNNESITYDNIGNPLSIGNKTLTWMNGRELSIYNDGINNISYKYNIDGIRTSKIVNNVETKYYLEGTKIIFEDRNGTMLYYLYNGDELLGFVYNNNTYYYHKNVFGDILGILDSSYNEIVTYEYDSWGAISSIIDNSGINLGTINPFRYRSYYYDEETKLYYLNSRYYNFEWGRFINGDGTVSTGQGFIGNNMFNYCGNNPIVRADDGGNKWWEVLGEIAGSLFGQKSEDKVETAATIVGAATSGIMSLILTPAVSLGAIVTAAAYGATASATFKYVFGRIDDNTEYIVDISNNTIIGSASSKITSIIGGIDPTIDAFVSGHISSYLGGEIVYKGKTKIKPKDNPSIFEGREPICSATVSKGKITTNCKNTKSSLTKNNKKTNILIDMIRVIQNAVKNIF